MTIFAYTDSMRKSYLFLGTILFIVSLFFFADELINLSVLKNGKIVTMKVVDLPESCIGTKAKWFMKVEYRGRIYSKQVSSGFCEKYTIGQHIKLRYLNDVDRVLLPTENLYMEFFSIVLLVIIGVSLIIKGFREATTF